MKVKAYAIQSEGEQLVPFTIERRDPGPEEVLVELMFCGICHTDLVVANNESKQAQYPVVHGHEMIGRVAEVGARVSKVAKGDLVDIGCIADSCRSCGSCNAGDEHYVVKIPDGLDPAGAAPLLCGGITVYTPLKCFEAGPGKRVGVAGLGGLGYLAIKMAKAMRDRAARQRAGGHGLYPELHGERREEVSARREPERVIP